MPAEIAFTWLKLTVTIAPTVKFESSGSVTVTSNASASTEMTLPRKLAFSKLTVTRVLATA